MTPRPLVSESVTRIMAHSKHEQGGSDRVAESAQPLTVIARFPIAALRSLVVLPGACIEGALAATVPLLIARATLGTAWLGLASAGLVLAPMLGTLAAPALERRLGNRWMTLITSVLAAASLCVAAVSWLSSQIAIAYGFVLLASAADSACDLGFTSRLPLFARLARERLDRFSGSNWVWAIAGVAIGSLGAGSLIAAERLSMLFTSLVTLSLIVCVGLAVLLPRNSRMKHASSPRLRAVFQRHFWRPQALKLAAILFAVVFFAGPIDNLLIPAHLASHGRAANTFGEILATAGLGVATSLAFFIDAAKRSTRSTAVIGLCGFALQLVVILILPSRWVLLSCVFVSAICFAPLLPMMQSAMLKAASAAQRTLMLAALATLVSLADMLGTLTFGAVVSAGGSALAISICLALVCLAAILTGLAAPRTPVTPMQAPIEAPSHD